MAPHSLFFLENRIHPGEQLLIIAIDDSIDLCYDRIRKQTEGYYVF